MNIRQPDTILKNLDRVFENFKPEYRIEVLNALTNIMDINNLDLNKKPFIFKVKCYTGIGYTLYDISEYPKLFEHYTIRTSFLWHSELFTLISHDIHNFTHLERLALIDKLYK